MPNCKSLAITIHLLSIVSQILHSQQSVVVRPLEPIAAKLEPSSVVTYKTGDKELEFASSILLITRIPIHGRLS